MKKLMIASAIAMTMAAGSAMATEMGSQQNQIQFLGAVTEVTCDIDAVIDGAVNNVVQLGTVKKGEEGQVKNIVLKAKAGTSCDGLDSKTATIAFRGSLGAEGLENANGTAAGATVALIAKNSNTPDQNITKEQSNVEFQADKVNTEGYKLTAQLKSDKTTGSAGTFESALAYAVTYQ
ncbi:fimbrial protein (plasmid) [Escherichia marmotae]|uniref:fimbrial protein n=1 Tax=Escherichia marmotae TaxID=1499973 RepID=UPI002433F984|nr:fimbrial protein [Escherichia marmotae]WFZ17189.1 fimbrial protein [Escherichia marmotae]